MGPSHRRLAHEKVTAGISSKTREVSLCASSVEALTFLVWRHLEHYLLYSGAASQIGQHTPIQEAYSRHVSYGQDQGYSTPGIRTGFNQVSYCMQSSLYFPRLTVAHCTMYILQSECATVQLQQSREVQTGILFQKIVTI